MTITVTDYIITDSNLADAATGAVTRVAVTPEAVAPLAAPTSAERRGRAMGSSLHLVVTGPAERLDELLDRSVALVAELERLWSRFDPGSEISQLNATTDGRPRRVSPPTAQLIRRGIEAFHLTDGLFDPTMLRAVIDAGYDRPFDELPPVMIVPGSAAPNGGPGCDDILIDGDLVTLPPGIAFDPGGLGKGLAADLVAEAAMTWGADGVMVNLGGDLRCGGSAPTVIAGEEANWVVGLPTDDSDNSDNIDRQAVVELAGGGVATSSCLRRRWATNDGEQHHLIDPMTGRPSAVAARSVTVLAASACDAETLATAIAARGSLPVDRSRLGGAVVILTDADGNRHTHGPVDEFLR